MSWKSPFEFEDYLAFLRALVASQKRRGYQAQLAAQAGCHPSFLSQVLGGRIHLGQEHALGIAEALALPRLDTEYLLAMVDHARAGSPRLRRFLDKRLRALRARHAKETRGGSIPEARLRSESEEVFYFGRWYRPAIHLLLGTSPRLGAQAIAERLGIERTEVDRVIRDLESMGLIRKEGARWRLQRATSHLSADSPVADNYHSLWRMRASLHAPTPGTLRYTGVHSVSREDVLHLRSLLTATLAAFRERVTRSPEEELIALTLDYFVV